MWIRYGLDHVDRNLLLAMIEKFQGGPVGLETLAASIGEGFGYYRGCLRAIPFKKWIHPENTERKDCHRTRHMHIWEFPIKISKK